MKYLLVLQWPANSIRDYDWLVRIEDSLEQKLSVRNEVDGHDAGTGEMNIFILTDDPPGTFQEIKATLGSHDFWVDARVAYREVEGTTYSILWPRGLTEFRVG